MKVRILRGNYFYHPPKDKGGRKVPVVVIPAGGEVDVSKSEAKRLILLGVAEAVTEVKPAAGEKPKSKADTESESAETPDGDDADAPDTDDDGDIVV